MNADSQSINDLSEAIIGRALVVSNVLGVGFLEKVHENALAHELRKTGLAVRQQHGVEVRYDGIVVGSYTTDLLVENAVLVELKATRTLDLHPCHPVPQLPEGDGLLLCLLLNFGNPRLQIRRFANGL